MKNILAIFLAFFIVAFANAKNNHSVVLDSLPTDLTENNVEFQALLQKAKAGDATSMYHLGICYTSGSFVKKDIEQGFEWTTKSAKAGYPGAWTELGYYYKNGTGRPIDFSQAYEMFSKAAELKDPMGIFNVGYMLYKGLGCKQDYKAAIVELEKSVKLNNAKAIYMLGLCYRNGFGVVKDTKKAQYLLRQAMNLGYIYAFEELQSKRPEYEPNDNNIKKYSEIAKEIGLKSGFPIDKYLPIQNTIKPNEANGTYEGFLLRYDLSGTIITEIKPISLSLVSKNSNITGVWAEQNRKYPLKFSAIWKNNKMEFQDTYYRRRDHYHDKDYPLSYLFKTADFQLQQKGTVPILRANVNIWTPDMNEPYYPVTLILSKKILDDTKVAQNSNAPISNLGIDKIAMEAINGDDLNAYPNPFDNEINVTFSLEAAADVTLKVSATDAKVLYRSEQKKLQSGAHFFSVPLAVPSGEYLVSLEIGNKIKTFKIVKP